jgi:hypothetical protein
MFEAMERGELTACYIIGENPLRSEADTGRARKLLSGLEHFVVQDMFLTDTAELATVVLPAPLTFEGVRAIGATLGSGVVLVLDDGVDMTDLLRRIARFFRDESCGQCVPCRLGTVRQEELLGRLLRGTPIGSAERELALLDDIATVARDASICGLGQTAVGAAQSAVSLGLIGGNGTGGNGKGPA